MTEGRYRLIGSTASPYAIKLRALLRYRRIPFDWVIMTRALRKQTEHLRPNLIPVLQYPDGSFRGETTALAYDLEARHRERSVIPEDSAVAFVCDLLEGRFFSIDGGIPKISTMFRAGQRRSGLYLTRRPVARRKSRTF